MYGDTNNMQYGNDDELNELLAKRMQEFSQRQASNNQETSPSYQNQRKTTTLAAPLILNDSNFAQAVEKYQLLVVDFWAPWCGPCRILSPTIEQLARELAGKVVFGKLNVDENPGVAGAFGIQSIPTIAIFKNGQAVDGFIGVASKSQVESKVLEYVANENRPSRSRSNNNNYFYR